MVQPLYFLLFRHFSLIQRGPEQSQELLSAMANDYKLLDPIGTGRGRYYTLSRKAYELMEDNMGYE